MDRLAGRQTRAPGPFWADGFRAHRLVYGATFLTLQTISGDVRNPRDGSESVLDTRGVRRRPPDLARRPTDLLLRHCRHCAVAFATSAILLILILRFVYGIAFRTFLNVFMIRIQASSHKLLFLPEYAC
jgi:hypothetical protein